MTKMRINFKINNFLLKYRHRNLYSVENLKTIKILKFGNILKKELNLQEKLIIKQLN